MAPVIDGSGVLVYSASGKDVDTVIIDGRIVVEAGQLATTDGPELVREAQHCAERLWSLAGTVPVTWPGGSC
jgi:cytosine/adenosine deaminase-related metal-dependent hydrolase